MRFKSFFIHKNLLATHGHTARKWAKTNGFTAYVSPVENPREVSIQIVQCTGKDEFCKKIGREQAMLAEPLIINKRDVPSVLAESEAYSVGSKTAYEGQWLWVLKYLV